MADEVKTNTAGTKPAPKPKKSSAATKTPVLKDEHKRTGMVVVVAMLVGAILASSPYWWPSLSSKVSSVWQTAVQTIPPPALTKQEPVAPAAPIVKLEPVSPAAVEPAESPPQRQVAAGPCAFLPGTHWNRTYSVCVPDLRRR